MQSGNASLSRDFNICLLSPDIGELLPVCVFDLARQACSKHSLYYNMKLCNLSHLDPSKLQLELELVVHCGP